MHASCPHENLSNNERYCWVSDFQCVICSFFFNLHFMIFVQIFFCWILVDCYGHEMGNDVRKWIPNQKHTRWPHKHHNMSIKLIQKSTRIHVYNFLKEKYQFCWSNVLSKQTWWKTLWKSEFALLPDHYFGNCFLLWMLYKDPDHFSVLYFSSVQSFLQFLYIWLIQIQVYLVLLNDFWKETICYDLLLTKPDT